MSRHSNALVDGQGDSEALRDLIRFRVSIVPRWIGCVKLRPDYHEPGADPLIDFGGGFRQGAL